MQGNQNFLYYLTKYGDIENWTLDTDIVLIHFKISSMLIKNAGFPKDFLKNDKIIFWQQQGLNPRPSAL